MTELTRGRCERFADDYDRVRRRYRFEYHLLYAMIACCAAERGRDVDPGALAAAEAWLQRDACPFSSLRRAVRLICAGALSLAPDPAAAFGRAEEAYAALRGELSPSAHLSLAALIPAREEQGSDLGAAARLTREIFDAMRRDHPSLTGPEALPLAALAACRGLNAPAVSAGVESAWTVLAPVLGRTAAVQTVSHCLALAQDPVGSADVLLRLWRAMKEMGRPFGCDTELIGLAALALTPDPDAALVAGIDDLLRRRRGFGNLALGARPRRMYAALLAALEDAPEGGEPAPALTLALAAVTAGMTA